MVRDVLAKMFRPDCLSAFYNLACDPMKKLQTNKFEKSRKQQKTFLYFHKLKSDFHFPKTFVLFASMKAF